MSDFPCVRLQCRHTLLPEAYTIWSDKENRTKLENDHSALERFTRQPGPGGDDTSNTKLQVTAHTLPT